MWGIAWTWKPFEWRLGFCEAYDEVEDRVVGRWLCLGPLAITYDYE